MRARNTRKVTVALAATIILLSLAPTRPAASQVQILYTVVELIARFGESISFPRAINTSGQAVGRSGYISDSDTRAVRWTLLGGVEELGTLPGGDYSAAFGVNAAGHVVGTSGTAGVVRAFRWDRDNGMRNLGTLPGGNGSEAFDINSAGDVVGTASGPGVRAVLWKSDGRILNLGVLTNGRYSKAVAISDSGHVVGTSGTPSGPRAFLWTESGGMRNLGTLPGHTQSEAADVNNLGQVVGYSSGPGGTLAFLWTSGGGMRSLGTLPGGDYSRAFGINNLGLVVGTSRSSKGMRAFLWTTGILGMRDLNGLIPLLEPGLVISEAHCISDLGLIGAISGGGEQAPLPGEDAHESEHFYRAFLLVP